MRAQMMTGNIINILTCTGGKQMTTPLYMTITRAIKEQIDCGVLAPGCRIPSVSDLRNQYGVSHITAMRVYKELLAMNCICGKRGAGYVVAQGRDASHVFCGRIGNFLRPLRPTNPNDNYFNTINFAVQDECCRLHLDLLSSHTVLPLSYPPYNNDVLQAITAAMLKMVPEVDGFLADERIPDDLLESLLPRISKPIVVVNRNSRLPLSCVTQPNREGMLAILDAAAKFNYSNYIFCEMGNGTFNEYERREAFYEYLRKKNISTERIRIIENCFTLSVEESNKKTDEAIKSFNDFPGRTLIVCSTDHLARHIADHILKKYGSFKETGVVSFNGFDLSTRTPKLATVKSNPVQLGVLAVRKLHSLLTTAEPRVHCNITTEVNFTLGETL